MSNQRGQGAAVVFVFVGVFVLAGVDIGLSVVLSFVSVVVLSVFLRAVVDGFFDGVLVSLRRRRRGSQSPKDVSAFPLRPARSLRWVSSLLPGDEGGAWWAEVTSCLAEAHDLGERRRYIRSYRRGVPQLIWTSWTTQLSASRRRTLS